MHQEREELVKFIFPKLRKLCEERGVTWGEVDLRWGITKEQTAEGKVLPICLAEIQRCRPYFIGLLGERYGWMPDEIPKELIIQEPWLAEHRSHSITELEILHGVLNNPDMANHAFFYLRSASYIDSLPGGQQHDFREIPTPEEIEKFGEEQAECHAEERRKKLQALKKRIQNSGFPVHINYRNPKELGELVLQDLTEVINQLYPEESVPSPLDKEALEHEAFAHNRCSVYIGRNEYFGRLEEHIKGAGLPLVVLGESGSGKSALLANWALRFRELNPNDLLIMHFIGASPQSTDWMFMLRRIMGEFKRRFDIQSEIPERSQALRAAFANWLHLVAERGKVVLILDALNQLADRDQALDLIWLPPEIPKNIRLMLSTLPGRSLDELKKRGWPTMLVESLEIGERKKLITEYLSEYTKELSTDHVEQITAAQQTSNPLFLRALLEELRVFGVQEKLDERIAYYLEANTIPELYEKILQRYEQDYECNRPNLVSDAMKLLWAARRGLSEVELLEMLGSGREPLPGAHWSPLYLAAEQGLVSHYGVLSFSHEYLRKAVQNRYLPTELEQKAAHLLLADYFKMADLGPRKVDELPWQLSHSKSWQQLYDLLTDLAFFDAAWNNDKFEVKEYWTNLESNSSLQIVDGYRSVIDSPAQHINYIDKTFTILHDTGHPNEAIILGDHLIQHYRKRDEREYLAGALINQATVFSDRGDLDKAMVLLKESEQICREKGNKTLLSTSLHNQADILYTRGDWDKALELHKEGERIFREIRMKDFLYASLHNQARILHSRGDLEGAMKLYKEGERICRELGNKDGLSTSLAGQALILGDRGDLDGAMALLKEQEQICRALGNKAKLLTSFNNQGVLFKIRGDLDGAMKLFKEGEQICRELGIKDELSAFLGNQGDILQTKGDLEGAMMFYKDQEQVCREIKNRARLPNCLNSQANILHAQDDLDGALKLYKESEQICRELGIKEWLATSLNNQGGILHIQGNLNGAMKLFKEAEQICRELEIKQNLPRILGNQALIFQRRHNQRKAMTLIEETEQICRELGNPEALANCLINKATMFIIARKPQEALPLAEEAYELATSYGLEAKSEMIKTKLDFLRVWQKNKKQKSQWKFWKK